MTRTDEEHKLEKRDWERRRQAAAGADMRSGLRQSVTKLVHDGDNRAERRRNRRRAWPREVRKARSTWRTGL